MVLSIIRVEVLGDIVGFIDKVFQTKLEALQFLKDNFKFIRVSRPMGSSKEWKVFLKDTRYDFFITHYKQFDKFISALNPETEIKENMHNVINEQEEKILSALYKYTIQEID